MEIGTHTLRAIMRAKCTMLQAAPARNNARKVHNASANKSIKKKN